MKANRKFREDNEGVSAVIGVILMVAITVAIAATVYVYVSGMIGGGATKAPDLAFYQDKSGGTLTVASVSETGISWGTVQITSTGNTTTLVEPTGTVSAGDVITSCSGTVTISYDNTTLLGTWTF